MACRVLVLHLLQLLLMGHSASMSQHADEGDHCGGPHAQGVGRHLAAHELKSTERRWDIGMHNLLADLPLFLRISSFLVKCPTL
jgi:hypothetical protein